MTLSVIEPINFNGLIFKLPSLDDKEAILAFKHAYLSSYENKTIHGSSGLDRFFDDEFEAWLDYVYAPVGTNVFGYQKMPSDTYFIYQNHSVVGVINIRHQLNEGLLKIGGHIGYSTHPAFQGMGIASTAVKFALWQLKNKGVDKVLITCDDDNLASAKVIEKNGGVLENVLATTGGHYRRYWIAT